MPPNRSETPAAPSSAFELQAKADEWMEVTPTEELLRAELGRLQAAFSKCSHQLESSRLENDLLKDRSAAQEKETSDLKQALEEEKARAKNALSEALAHHKRTRTELEETLEEKKAAEARAEASSAALEDRLSQANREKEALEEKLAGATKALSTCTKTITRMQTEAAAAKAAAEKHAETISQRAKQALSRSKEDISIHKNQAVRFAEDLRRVRESHSETKKALSASREETALQTKKRKQAEATTQTIAVLAESLKAKIASLEGSLVVEAKRSEKTKQDLEDRCGALSAELKLRRSDLEELGASHEKLRSELTEAEADLRGRSVEAASQKARAEATESCHQGLLERQAELEDDLEEVRDELDRAHSDVHSTRAELEETQRQTATLRESTGALLRLHLEDQRKEYEARLHHLHSILGLTFARAVRNEVAGAVPVVLDHLLPREMKQAIPLLLASASSASASKSTVHRTHPAHAKTKATTKAKARAVDPPPSEECKQ